MRYALGVPISRIVPPAVILALGLGVVGFGAGGDSGFEHQLPSENDDPISFGTDVRPILSGSCFKCHGPDDAARQAGLRLDSREGALIGGRRAGAAIVPGNAEASELLRRVSGEDPSHRMPPGGEALKPEQIEVLRRWIDQGAQWERHWSFVAPQRRATPIVSDPAWCRSPIDRFVMARLDGERMVPNPEATRSELITRLSLDLTGLPPTPDQVRAFTSDNAADAYERLVDRLLASPAFGERWASVWLDQARYADTKGYEKDARRTMWPYRDWVIRALNDDMAFDQFTIEQLAGDLLDEPTQDQLVATAFHRNTMTNDEGGTDDEEFRTAAIIDRVNTTMQSFMGLTAGCAQCHTHKYDPITHTEYYRLFAYFNQSSDADRNDEAPTLAVPQNDQKTRLDDLDAQMATAQAQLDALAREIAYEEPSDPGSPDESPSNEPAEFIWIDDRAPVGSTEHQTGGPKAWLWLDPTVVGPHSGTRSSGLRAGKEFAQFFAVDPLVPLLVGEKAQLFAHVWLDPNDPAREIMLQWRTKRADWGHRAYWGENLIMFGADGTPERLHKGELPANGAWIRLEIEAEEVGLQAGDEITGWAFSQHTGTVAWDASGIVTKHAQDSTYLRSQDAWERLASTTPQGLPEHLRSAITIDRADRSPEQVDQLRTFYLQRVNEQSWRGFDDLDTKIRAIETEIASVKSQVPKLPIMRELAGDARRSTHRLEVGSHLSPAEEVSPGVPGFLHPQSEAMSDDRLGLAGWIVSPDNPLTARVLVNRIWSRLLGRGLVSSEENFGFQGLLPSHPDLLDWLAVEFMDRGWSLKQLLRAIVTSATYRQSSVVNPEQLLQDPNNELLARGARYRLSAETIRDRSLHVSGLLSAKMYGPSVFPPQPAGVWQVVYSGDSWQSSTGEDRYRRGLYTFWRRTSPYPSMTTFDAPSREFCVPRRIRTGTPLQALVTLNDPAFVEMAQAMARRIVREGGDSEQQRARWALELALCREAGQDEVDRLVGLFDSERAHYALNVEEARQLAEDPLGPVPDGMDPSELAAWTVVANVIMNLDEFLTRN